MFAALSTLPKESLMQWGWRLPFLAGFSLVLVGLYMRLQVRETPVFQQLDVVALPLNGQPDLLADHQYPPLALAPLI